MMTRCVDLITGLTTILPDEPWADVPVGSRDGVPLSTAASVEFGEFLGFNPDVAKLDWFSAQLFSDLWKQTEGNVAARSTIHALIPRLSDFVDELTKGNAR